MCYEVCHNVNNKINYETYHVIAVHVITSSTVALILHTNPIPTAWSTDLLFVNMSTILALNSELPDLRLTTLCRSEGLLVKSLPINWYHTIEEMGVMTDGLVLLARLLDNVMERRNYKGYLRMLVCIRVWKSELVYEDV